ncbi:aromatic ring-hydroxylating oxygenase subunit alpha [Streptomyces chromofuscus]|uniref:aromatic ring-hydroxylating oxygenase subunit alpha n=1 Tax=Streptomyces chromofuscus TaxID=42881 RepID=UPI0016786B74|nr:aromatic ring-hydroxylating dioxygenase subunit alpha [Streptomyces chromofuscus]
MLEKNQAELADRLLRHIDDGTTDVAQQTSERRIDAYRDGDIYRRELDTIFRHRPVIVAHDTQLQSPGDYVADDVYGIPYLVVRQASGEIRGFVNLCRHRGTRLADPGSGKAVADGFTCPWHGWRYGLSGELCGIPDQQRGFPGLDTGRRGLLPLRTEVRHGFVWVTPESDGTRTVAEHLGPLDSEFAAVGMESYTFYEQSRTVAGFNWKLGIEAFLETYHFRWLHPAMKKYVFAPDLSLVDAFGEHVRLVAPKKSVLENRALPPQDRRIRDYATIAYTIFPSTVLFLEKRHITVMSMRPAGVDSCDVHFLHIVQEDTLRRRSYWDDNMGKFMDAAAEDFAVLELTQHGIGRDGGMRIPGHETVLFGRNERGLQLFRSSVDSALGTGSDA